MSLKYKKHLQNTSNISSVGCNPNPAKQWLLKFEKSTQQSIQKIIKRLLNIRAVLQCSRVQLKIHYSHLLPKAI